jgi:hypothetical protein
LLGERGSTDALLIADAAVRVDPAPFAISERTQLPRVHYLFAICLFSEAFVVAEGALCGVILKDDLSHSRRLLSLQHRGGSGSNGSAGGGGSGGSAGASRSSSFRRQGAPGASGGAAGSGSRSRARSGSNDTQEAMLGAAVGPSGGGSEPVALAPAAAASPSNGAPLSGR